MVVMAKISIRELRISDAENLVKYGDNKKIWDNMRDYFPNPYRFEDACKFIKTIGEMTPITTFAICYDDELIGVIGYNLQTDIYSHSGEIGYWIGEPFWGQGIVSIAINEIIDHAFNITKLKRLYTSVFEHNIASARVLEKAGFFYEGKGINAVLKNDILYNDVRYALLNPNLSS